jgi:hypothetical protein
LFLPPISTCCPPYSPRGAAPSPFSQNPNTSTVTATANKNAARDALKDLLRSIYDDIPESALTADDRTTLNLPERSTTRTPAPVPTTKPIAKIDTSKRLEHTIHFKDEDGSLAKPEGVRGCQIWVKIGASAKDPDELRYLATDTKTPRLWSHLLFLLLLNLRKYSQ